MSTPFLTTTSRDFEAPPTPKDHAALLYPIMTSNNIKASASDDLMIQDAFMPYVFCPNIPDMCMMQKLTHPARRVTNCKAASFTICNDFFVFVSVA